MKVVQDLRASARVTQSELAKMAGTSQPTIAAYEAGTKSPTLRTLARLASAAGRDVVISFVPASTREDRRSLHLHRAIAEKLRRSPESTVDAARRNLRRMLPQHPEAEQLLRAWNEILDLPTDMVIEVMIDPAMQARDLRQVTPFAGILTAAERAEVYGAFARSEAGR